MEIDVRNSDNHTAELVYWGAWWFEQIRDKKKTTVDLVRWERENLDPKDKKLVTKVATGGGYVEGNASRPWDSWT